MLAPTVRKSSVVSHPFSRAIIASAHVRGIVRPADIGLQHGKFVAPDTRYGVFGIYHVQKRLGDPAQQFIAAQVTLKNRLIRL